ncbi:hypothetical protein AB0O76_35875 [Streptomyces sp. NPDC086554]|uniref:hypothetical protein n=1 Tax=Streptomyces sp. NPDC086554 TaxID=3154864 RepID=UPI0034217C07
MTAVAILGGGFIGYKEIFLSGIEELPNRPCKQGVQRSTASNVLPAARNVEESSRQTLLREGDFLFHCAIMISGESSLSVNVRSADVKLAKWKDFYRASLKGKEVDLSGEPATVSWPRETVIYMRCTPPGRKASSALETYALNVDAKIVGEARISGTELRQQLTEFALQAAEHSHKAAKCQEAISFPDTPPRVDASR